MSNKKKTRWSVASLIFLITIAAILAGWYVDHQRLVSQIEPPQQKLATVFRLTQSSAEEVKVELENLYPNQTINSEPTSNSLIVVADQDVHGQIALLVNYIEQAKAAEVQQDDSHENSNE